MATAKQRAWRRKFASMYGGKKKRSSRKRGGSGKMARRRKSRRSYSRGGGLMGGDMIGNGIKGVGVAALAKRFVGAPLGGFTGAAGGFLLTKSVWGAVGGYIHDNIGNVGGASNSGGSYY